MSEIRLADPLTGEEVTIPLSPEIGGAENIAALYKQHRKFRNGLEKIAERMRETEVKAGRERELIAAIEATTTIEELETLGLVEAAPQKLPVHQKKKAAKAFPGYRRFTSVNGFEMIVGRNDVQNDDLVRHSNGNDLWFHIRDFPGSHVLVRTAKIKDVPFDTILEAAKLALKFSTKAQDKRGTVVYTYVKYLRRPKNAPPGRVLVTREKTVQVGIE
jgi:predicted ribosome quality control (RQC) complex YloA/Tae2 family protein